MAKKLKSVSYSKYGYYFSIPFVLAFLIFQLYPVVYTLVIGFTNLKGVVPIPVKILDDPLQNFKTILNMVSFQKSLSNTAIIWVMCFIPQLFLALLLAAWYTNRHIKVKGQGLFKVLIYMPNIITAATIALLFSSLFGYPKGVVNDILMQFGITENPMNFTLMKWNARGVVAFIQFWMWYGHTMIVLIAGIMGISPSHFEAAEIDGANAVQIFFKITLPQLRTIILYTLVTSMIGGLYMFDIPRLYNLGGPDQATQTAAIFVYNQAFSGSYMYNRAAAASMLLFVIAAVISGYLFYVLRDKDEVKLRKQERKRIRAAKAAVKISTGGNA